MGVTAPFLFSFLKSYCFTVTNTQITMMLRNFDMETEKG
jgi:hypothetical protein